MNMIQLATAGEALIDLIGQPDGRFEPCLGGAVFNLTRALARQDIGTLYLNPLSADRFGRQLAQALVDDGVSLACPEPVPQSTSLAVVALTETGHPDYAFYREQVADRAVDAEGLIRACAAQGALRVVCTGALALAAADATSYLPWLHAQRVAGRLVVVDANLRPSVMPNLAAYRRNVLEALHTADIIKVSDEDLAYLDTPGDGPLARAQHLLAESSAQLLVLTLGGEGACLLARDGRVWRGRESQPVPVVDTVGAGDCFLAGLLSALLRSGRGSTHDLRALDDVACRHLLSHALASASLCVMQSGCVPPDWAQVCERVRQVPARFA